MTIHKIIIIGSGPAGLTAAIYAARANLSPLLFEGFQAGGQLMITTEVENYPGFPHGIQGPELMHLWREQAHRFGTEIVSRDVTRVNFSDDPIQKPHEVWVDDTLYQAHAVIISTGASARWLGIDSEKKFMGRGVSACATCDGAFFKNEIVALVGGGDTAMEEALFLTRFAKEVHVIHRRNSLRASKIMQDRAMKHEKIRFIWNTVVDECLGDTQLKSIRLRNVETGETSELACGGLFIAIGHEPNTKIFTSHLKMDANGYLITEPGSTRTGKTGVFAAGDVQDSYYRQAVTAAGTGCMAAIDAERFLESAHL
jgi:thioredoxin reductase (NADPH)